MAEDPKNFRKFSRLPVCTVPPWQVYINPKDRPETLRIIRQETISEYGHSFDECPKRKVCLGKNCLGRPLPWKSKTAKPLLEKLKKTHNIINGELFIDTDCGKCPVRASCYSPCNQVLDYIDKDKTIEPNIEFNDQIEILPQQQSELFPANWLKNKKDIPWDCLSDQKKQLVETYLYQQRDFRQSALESGLLNQAYAKYKFYSALTRLAEFAIMRDFYTKNHKNLTEEQKTVVYEIYFNNKTQVEVARHLKTSTQNINQILSRLITKYKIHWHKFVTKKKGVPVYNTLEVLK